MWHQGVRVIRVSYVIQVAMVGPLPEVDLPARMPLRTATSAMATAAGGRSLPADCGDRHASLTYLGIWAILAPCQ